MFFNSFSMIKFKQVHINFIAQSFNFKFTKSFSKSVFPQFNPRKYVPDRLDSTEKTDEGIEELVKRRNEDLKEANVKVEVNDLNIIEERRKTISKLVEKYMPATKDVNKSKTMFKYLIQAFFKDNMIEEVKELIYQMDSRQIVPTLEIFHELLEGFSTKSILNDVEWTIELMRFYKIQLDNFTFNCLIKSYSSLKKPLNCREMLNFMHENNVQENITTFNMILKTYASIGVRTKYLDELLKVMTESSVKPNEETYTLLILCSKSISRAIKYYRESITAAKNAQITSLPDPKRFDAMITALKNCERIDLALDFVIGFMKRYPDYVLTPLNHVSLFTLKVHNNLFQEAFDDLDLYITSLSIKNSDGSINYKIPSEICSPVVEVLYNLPESAIEKNSRLLKRWKKENFEINAPYLSEPDSKEWIMSFLRWRKTYSFEPTQNEKKKNL